MLIKKNKYTNMNIIEAARNYVAKITDCSEPGMNILLMDKETTSILSMVYGQSEIMQRDVYLLERFDSPSFNATPSLRYLKCLLFVRPTSNNIDLLCTELNKPKYGSYYIYFSNIVPKAFIKILAERDEHEVVKEVQEVYLDYLAVNPHLFSFGLPFCSPKKWLASVLDRSLQGMIAVLLSLRKCPIIRYNEKSTLCKEFSSRLEDIINKEGSLFTFKPNCLLLVLDRREDTITPLLNQWTYQAMVHELFTINNNRVAISSLEDKNNTKEAKEVVLSAEQDTFYGKNIFLNYGEIGQNIKQFIDEYQLKAKNHTKIESISDMKHFVESYPQFKKLSGNLNKHVNLVYQLNQLVMNNHLLEISELEQDLVMTNDQSRHYQSISRFIQNDIYKDRDVIKLVMLYGLRYQQTANNQDVHSLINLLKKRNVPGKMCNQVIYILKYDKTLGSRSRDLSVDGAIKISKRLFNNLKGVDNIYTQHKPLLHETLNELSKNKLKDTVYPIMGNRLDDLNRQLFDDVIIFMIGGCTYVESMVVHTFNKSNSMNVMLGGTTIHNSRSFIEHVEHAMKAQYD